MSVRGPRSSFILPFLHSYFTPLVVLRCDPSFSSRFPLRVLFFPPQSSGMPSIVVLFLVAFVATSMTLTTTMKMMDVVDAFSSHALSSSPSSLSSSSASLLSLTRCHPHRAGVGTCLPTPSTRWRRRTTTMSNDDDIERLRRRWSRVRRISTSMTLKASSKSN
jgi:hypothetical protein